MSQEFLYRFCSKRNWVILVKGEWGLVVEKHFSSLEEANREKDIYQRIEGRGLWAPSLLIQKETTLVLSYLEGEDYLSLLTRQERVGVTLWPWESLLDWLCHFYQVTGMVQRDVNLRNFLLVDGRCAGLDFEDCGPGSLPGSIARLCAYILNYGEEKTREKKEICAYLKKSTAERGLCQEEQLEALVMQEEKALLKRREQKRKGRKAKEGAPWEP